VQKEAGATTRILVVIAGEALEPTSTRKPCGSEAAGTVFCNPPSSTHLHLAFSLDRLEEQRLRLRMGRIKAAHVIFAFNDFLPRFGYMKYRMLPLTLTAPG
jgi:hypothetical protein